MSKVSIVYIGPKAVKKDTVNNSRQMFRRYEPVEVDEAHAANYLKYPTVWIEAEKLDEVKAAEAAEAEAKQAEQEELAKLAEAEKEAIDFTVTIDGEDYDLNKMNSPKIGALVIGADLDIEPKGAQESAQDYKVRVRDSIRSLSAE
jgi:hypothetical protein